MHIKECFQNINLKRKDYFEKILHEYDINMVQLEILVYLSEFPKSNTFTDIIKRKDYTKSHISTSITYLVSSGFIEKRGCIENKKVFKLCLLEKSKPLIKEYYKYSLEFNKQALKDISESEIEQFEKVLKKMSQNLGD